MKNKKLCDFTDQELYEFLCKNEEIEMSKLGAICSEILRRQLKPRFEEDSPSS